MSELKHVAIIMDGNGRWANLRSHKRIWGHVRGASIVSEIIEEADELGIKALTLYAFSTENWSRPIDEVKTLFQLLHKYLLREKKRIMRNGVQFRVIGEYESIPAKTQVLIRDLEECSAQNKGLKLSFAFGYGGRREIIRAVNRAIEKNPGMQITESMLEAQTYRPEVGDVDLLIRTGGDQRISNFLIWQTAYAELFFTPTRWPDFTRKEFKEICLKFSDRERRFGSVTEAKSLNETVRVAEENLAFHNQV